MIIGNFTQGSIEYVFCNIWDKSKDEADIFNISMDELKRNYTKRITEPWSFAFYEKLHGECCALGYLEPIGHLIWRSNFIATQQGFNKIWFPMSIFMKRLSDHLVGEGNGTGYIEILSDPRNKKAEEWFNVMGFYLLSRTEKVDKYVKFGKMYHTKAVGHGDNKERVLCAEVIK
jgi:hypothetical protein